MKKITAGLIGVALIMSLTACEVPFFGEVNEDDVITVGDEIVEGGAVIMEKSTDVFSEADELVEVFTENEEVLDITRDASETATSFGDKLVRFFEKFWDILKRKVIKPDK